MASVLDEWPELAALVAHVRLGGTIQVRFNSGYEQLEYLHNHGFRQDPYRRALLRDPWPVYTHPFDIHIGALERGVVVQHTNLWSHQVQEIKRVPGWSFKGQNLWRYEDNREDRAELLIVVARQLEANLLDWERIERWHRENDNMPSRTDRVP